MGSRRTTPTAPVLAAVVSEPMVAPAYTPESQFNDSLTRGTPSLRLPPYKNAEIGTPLGFSQSGSNDGHWVAATVKRAFGCAALRPQAGVHSLPCQSMSCGGGSFVMPSHHTSPSGVSATFVNITFSRNIAI